MAELKKMCEAIVQGREYLCNNNRKRVLYNKYLNVNKRMFGIYLKTGKCKKNNFPLENINVVLCTNRSEIEKIVKTFFDVGWKPEVHVMLTRKKCEKFTLISGSMIY